MFKRNAIAAAVGGAALFAGCAAPPQPARLAVEPVMAVRGGGAEAERLYRIGRQYQGQKRHANAEEAFLKALAHDANHAEAHNALAVTYFEQGLIRQAEQQFRLAIAAAPGRAHLHNNLAHLYREIGRDDDAISAYSAALLVEPDNRRALEGLAALTCRDQSACAAAAAPAPAAKTDSAPAPAAAQSIAPTVQLASVAPGVWELRPLSAAQPSRPAGASPASYAAPQAVAAPRDAAAPADRRVEVANGNGVPGLARRVGVYLHEQGFAAPRLTNHRNFRQQYTEVQYVPGAEALARSVSGSFDGPARLVAVTRLERRMPVRLVLGRDFNESQSMANGRRPSGRQVALAPMPEQE